MSYLRLLLVILFVFSGAIPLRADLTMTLSPSIQNSARGREIVFSGTLTNTSVTDKLFLNEIVSALSGTSAGNLALNASSFFSNVPGILLPNESYTSSEIFRIVLNGAAPADDYGGTVTIRGGADIFANGDLATTAFGVLSPDVGLVTSAANASEVGPASGAFTISRTGSTAIDLPVFFTMSGTALNGAAYSAIMPSATIPAGSSSTTVTITPIPNNLAEGDRSVILSLGTSLTYNLGSPLSDTVTIHDKPVDAWRFDKFGINANGLNAADNADPDGDGITNLLEFALGLDPNVSDRAMLPTTFIAGDYLTISFVPNAAATDLSYIVEASTDLEHWDASNVEVVTVVDPNPPGLQAFRYKIPVSASDQAFIRLRVVRTDL